MQPVAAILGSLVIYRYSLVLALSGAAGVCFFLGCCHCRKVPTVTAAAAALTAVMLSLPLSRLVYWYGRPDSFSCFSQALTASNTEALALSGAFGGCILSAFFIGRRGCRQTILDCMCVSGCGAISLGRLGCFFTEANRGQIMTRLTGLPWAWPVANASGHPEYRFATFLFQAVLAALLGIFLTAVFFSRKTKRGDVTILFVLFYSASQFLLDSTRYDSLYLRSNGFVSMVQVLSAVALVLVTVLLCIRTVKALGFRKWMIPLWLGYAVLFSGTGYLEYYVQRHGREAAFSYSMMGTCLAAIVILGLLLWRLSRKTVSE